MLNDYPTFLKNATYTRAINDVCDIFTFSIESRNKGDSNEQ